MKKVKRRAEFFSLYDHTGMEEHLTRMAEKGWLLEKIGRTFWTYRRIQPKKLTFSVCYFPKASQFDPGPSEEQQTFFDFCRHTGWVLACTHAQLQVFYNEQPDPVPIETDPVQEVRTIHKAMKKTLLPSYLFLLLIGIMYAALSVFQLRRSLVDTLSSPSSLLAILCWILILLMTVVEFASYVHWYRRALRAAERGETYRAKGIQGLQYACLAVLWAGLLYSFSAILASGDRLVILSDFLLFLIYLPGLHLLVNGIKGSLKKRGASTGVNRAVTFVGAVILALALMSGVIYVVIQASRSGWFRAPDRETYSANGFTWTAYNDPLPLSVEDLTGVPCEGYDRERREEGTFLLARIVAVQRARFDIPAGTRQSMPRLNYTVTVIKAPFLYDACREDLLSGSSGGSGSFQPSFQRVDPAPWGAAEAYKLFRGQYLLCYEGRIVELEFTLPDGDWEPTEVQMALIGRKLGRGAL